MFSRFIDYHPLLRTRDAELKGYKFLPKSIKQRLVPIFELTRSRTSKNNKIGNIYKQLDKLEEVIDANQPFMLDLTTEDSLSNSQIDTFLHTTENGFSKWVNFLKDIRNSRFENIIPTIIYNDEATEADFVSQIQKLEREFDYVAFRIDVYDDETQNYVGPILDNFRNKENLVLIFDAGFIPVPSWRNAVTPAQSRMEELMPQGLRECRIISMSSSFPKTVVATGYGNDESGEFPLVEVDFTDELSRRHQDLNIIHGDYAGIHPIRYQAGGGGWIPRIDVPRERDCFYHRYRREDDGYITAAVSVLQDEKYERLPLSEPWADNEIVLAASGTPNGKSPSHWIAVRSNMHMVRQAMRLNPLA